jgi:hypothetical protein
LARGRLGDETARQQQRKRLRREAGSGAFCPDQPVAVLPSEKMTVYQSQWREYESRERRLCGTKEEESKRKSIVRREGVSRQIRFEYKLVSSLRAIVSRFSFSCRA